MQKSFTGKGPVQRVPLKLNFRVLPFMPIRISTRDSSFEGLNHGSEFE
jgi:hypothetical protein